MVLLDFYGWRCEAGGFYVADYLEVDAVDVVSVVVFFAVSIEVYTEYLTVCVMFSSWCFCFWCTSSGGAR